MRLGRRSTLVLEKIGKIIRRVTASVCSYMCSFKGQIHLEGLTAFSISQTISNQLRNFGTPLSYLGDRREQYKQLVASQNLYSDAGKITLKIENLFQNISRTVSFVSQVNQLSRKLLSGQSSMSIVLRESSEVLL